MPKRGDGPASTIVCNHIGWIEVMGLITSPLHPGFTPKDDFMNTPLLGTCCRGLQSLFIARGASQEKRDKVVEQIAERQEAIEVGMMPFNPICIFAEGTTTNGTSLLKFKRGAFSAMRTVIPVFVKASDRYMMPSYETMEFLPMLIQFLSSLCIHNL